jgi:hypothetical protein
MASICHVYLVEKVINGRLEPIAVLTGLNPASDRRLQPKQIEALSKLRLANILDEKIALITKINLNQIYHSGIGNCEHWHY